MVLSLDTGVSIADVGSDKRDGQWVWRARQWVGSGAVNWTRERAR